MTHVTQLSLYVSHFVTVARRSNRGLKTEAASLPTLSACIYVTQNIAELEIGAPFFRRTPRTTCAYEKTFWKVDCEGS